MPSHTLAATVYNSGGRIQTLTNLLQAFSFNQRITPPISRCATYPFSTTAVQQSIKKKRNKKRINDPYRAAQAQQRKSANLARQATLQQQRKAALGDPIRSKSTPFIQSLLNPLTPTTTASAPSSQDINFLLRPEDVAKQIAHSKWLAEPIPLAELNRISSPDDPQKELKRRQDWEEGHGNAERAVHNITSLAQGSSKDRTRLNIQRCIEEFGRHTTDLTLPPKPASLAQSGTSNTPSNASGAALTETEKAAAEELAAIPSRVGKDTGSSEVQIAILTAKINTLASNLGRKDKHNKRNLRLLVHRRQKLLAYLRRRERGGPRWQHLVEKLGINDAMWKGEISL